MKLTFNKTQYTLGHWRRNGNYISRSLFLQSEPYFYGMYYNSMHNIYLSRISSIGDPTRYQVYGEGYLFNIATKFNDIYNYP